MPLEEGVAKCSSVLFWTLRLRYRALLDNFLLSRFIQSSRRGRAKRRGVYKARYLL